MAFQLIPLDTSPNQQWQVSVSINGVVSTFNVTISYNEVAQLQEMSIYDANFNPLVTSLPLVTGLNLLAQFGYLNIGSIAILNVSGVDPPDYPNDANLGTSFVMVWGDTVSYVA